MTTTTPTIKSESEPESEARFSSKPGSTKKAVECALLSALGFSVMFALIKLLGKGYPAGEVLFCRSFFALIPLVPVVLREGGLKVFETKHPVMHLTRSVVGLSSACLCIESLKLLPLSEATTLFYAAPLITTVLAICTLGEKVTKGKVIAISIGFLGVVYMMQPQLSSSIPGALMALASAISSGFVYIELRKMSATEKSITIVVYFMLACSLGGLLSLPFQMVIPTLHDAFILLGIGVIGGMAQLSMTEAYRHAPASTVAPLSFSALVWAALLDIILFSKLPGQAAIVGTCLIALSGIFVVRQSSK
ncbi:MAG: hypothetical protein QG574_4572 [Cyanobacteriota bacterium erpe_2018_sw_21hr_WHONDRS-SW48-000092_B_bin.40]|nr:hypothetical protein [Cyanobacteriota bacterium erpe_2018_sw_21hr_WHONDRS-SW48-000092_B_bin.40]